jgi:hypothetical protein
MIIDQYKLDVEEVLPNVDSIRSINILHFFSILSGLESVSKSRKSR